MTAAADDEMHTLDIREKIAHIDLMLAQHDRTRQEMRFAPWVVVISGFTAGAAFFAAAFALAKFLQ